MQDELIKPYKYVAQIYSHLMRFIKYDNWAEYIYDIAAPMIPENARVLELAGGNGKLSSHLLKYYNGIITSDISYEMLHESSSKELLPVCCDMKLLPFKSHFDLIICAFDSINYLTSQKALSSFFHEVALVMNQESIFTFDASLELNSVKHERYLNRSGIYKNIKYVQRSKYDTVRKIHTNSFLITLENGQTIREMHRQKIYPVNVFFDLLDQNDLYVKYYLNAFSFDDASEKSERVQFVVARKNNA
jgi:SAM-dependent methyltransferase